MAQQFIVRMYDDNHSAFETIEADSLDEAFPIAESLCKSFVPTGEEGGWDIVPPDDETTDKPLATGSVVGD